MPHQELSFLKPRRLNMRPTNKPVTITAVNIDRLVDGKIVEHGGAANLLEPLLKIGAIRIADPVVTKPSGE